ncbi:MAG: large conductance mechanosensitive channel protein MscL [Clostridia bacterium]|nr:large conductance mechanosensitive channel protein MscL [Clostridia bacterium]
MKKSTFFKDFKAFISRGNVLDMAIGVIVGASFGQIVSGLVNYILNPFVALFVKSGSLDSIKTVITPAVLDEAGNVVTAETAILWGSWLQTIIDFLITSFCIFVIIRLASKARAAAEKVKESDKGELEAKVKAEAEAKEADAKAKAEAEAKEQRQKQLEDSLLNQEKLLQEIKELMKNK